MKKIVIIGAGIVGLAIARELSKNGQNWISKAVMNHKMHPRAPQEAAKMLSRGTRRPEEAPRGIQEAPKRPQEGQNRHKK